MEKVLRVFIADGFMAFNKLFIIVDKAAIQSFQINDLIAHWAKNNFIQL